MSSFKVILLAFLVFGILLFAGQKENFKTAYIKHNKTNYPGGNIIGGDISNQYVKNGEECEKLCNAAGGRCAGYALATKPDPAQGGKRMCYLKTAAAITPANKRIDPNWNMRINPTHYNSIANMAQSDTKTVWGGSRDVSNKRCGGLQVTIYSDKEATQNPKSYGCGDTAIFNDSGKNYGMSAYSVPAGLTMKLYGIPTSADSEYTYSPLGVSMSTPADRFSGPITGTGNLKDFENGVWNDRVKSIRVEAAY